ncbi:Kinase-like protein [Mycena indigotica]|uniref:Kinase-like protein n=1 Tax=Mycena indigotica TaxID=2126181 RepID=A0A8H6SJI4_9AGAR|nr:Kinase-like protein [Mycena indigotica]KAF7299457.1 Kinase-like protein [Mycena indigotica]
MRRLFGRDNARVNFRPTPFLQTGPSNGGAPPQPASAQTWAPVQTVANYSDIHELVHRIRFLASMGSEDRPLVLDMCDRASTDTAAREAVKALMHEFKCGTADAQLSAARLWAILLRNSSTAFISQSAAPDFLDSVAELLVSPRTSPVVRHRVLRVLGDAVWNNPTKEPFRRLWLSVKPVEEPEQGSPYNAHDAILRPPATAVVTSTKSSNRGALPMADGRFPPSRTPLQILEWDAPPPSYEFATETNNASLRGSWVYSPSRRVSNRSSSSSSNSAPVRRRQSDQLSYASTDDFILDISPAHSPTLEEVQAQDIWPSVVNAGRSALASPRVDVHSSKGSSGTWSTRANAGAFNSNSASSLRSRQSWHSETAHMYHEPMIMDVQALSPVEQWRAGVAEENPAPKTPSKPRRVPRLKPSPVPSKTAGKAKQIAATRRKPFGETDNYSMASKPEVGILSTTPTSNLHRGDRENSKLNSAIYANTLVYLKDVAWNNDESASLIKLSSFSKAISQLNPMNSLVFALQYRQLLLQISMDLNVSEDRQLMAALKSDHDDITNRLLDVLYSSTDEQAVLSLEDESAQSFLDVVQFTLDHALLHKRDANSRARRLISKLARIADKLPTALIISGVEQRDEHATFCGGFGDVFRAIYQGKPVALKHMRRFQGSDQRDIRKKFCREALVWQRLRHPFVVPLIGIDTESFPTSLCLVSPWMRHGTVINYLKTFHGASRRVVIDRLIREIAQGLAFLHDQNVVHGDLRGSNILIDDDGHACLTDFGLTVLSDATTQTQHGAGSVRWMAPEILNPTACGLEKFAKTTASDIYAFACVCLELYTGFPPFHAEILHDAPVILQVMAGVRPSKPDDAAIPDYVWEIMQQSWSHNHADRPTILGIVLELAMHERVVERDFSDTISMDECEEPSSIYTSDSASMSSSCDQAGGDYDGWASSVIAPLNKFIDRNINPREHFVHLREIAEGFAGSVVYEAHAGLDDGDVITRFSAIKTVPILPGGTNTKLGELVHELQVMEHVPPAESVLRVDSVYIDTVEDVIWIHMELMDRSLASLINLIGAGLRLSDRVIAGCAKDILGALNHLQSHNVAMGNLASKNVLINSDGFVKITNFSSAVKLSPNLTDHKRGLYIEKDRRALGSLVLELAAASRAPSQMLHDFVQLCFHSEKDYKQLMESAFIRDACPRFSLTQLLGHCTMFDLQRDAV